MFAALTLTLFAGPLVLQVPGESLERSLADPDPSARMGAAETLAAMQESGLSWILREHTKGSSTRKRAILLAAALMGTEETLEVVERASRSRNKRDDLRAYALFLLGAFDPEAAKEPGTALRRAVTDFDRTCFVIGLMAQAQRVDAKALARRVSTHDAGIRAALHMLEILAGRRVEREPLGDAELGARLLGTLVEGAESLPAAWLEGAGGRVPGLWLEAALRQPGRDLKILNSKAPGGDGDGMALSLFEFEPDSRIVAFQLLDRRLIGPVARAWLWGSAGALGLRLPPPRSAPGGLDDAEVGGILRLALVDYTRARQAAGDRRTLARERFVADEALRDCWPAAVILALDPEPKDIAQIKERMDASEGPDRLRLQPIWLLAKGRLASADAREPWFRKWARELEAGRLGFLDQEGRRWAAYVLAGGTGAAETRAELRKEYPGMQGARDHPPGNELFRDLAEVILSDHYRWEL